MAYIWHNSVILWMYDVITTPSFSKDFEEIPFCVLKLCNSCLPPFHRNGKEIKLVPKGAPLKVGLQALGLVAYNTS